MLFTKDSKSKKIVIYRLVEANELNLLEEFE